jgi:hypothetical protein
MNMGGSVKVSLNKIRIELEREWYWMLRREESLSQETESYRQLQEIQVLALL